MRTPKVIFGRGRFCTGLVITLLLIAASSGKSQVPLENVPYWTTSELDVYTTGMIWRDCDNDGDVDVFFSNGNDIEKAANMIYISDGGILPSTADWYSSRVEFSGHSAVGDLNDDGYVDWVVSNFIGNSFATPNISELYLNQGGLPGTSPVWYSPDSMYSFSCALVDFDLDGDLDVVFATGEGYQSHYEPDRIYENVNGALSSASVWQSQANTAALDVAAGDVDNDGDMDIAFCYDNRATSMYYNSEGTIETVPTWQSSTVESGNTLHFWDVNNDNWLDLVVAYNDQLGGTGRYKVYFNKGDGTLNSVAGWQSATGDYGSALAFYDYDRDGDDDLAAGRWFSQLRIYENLGTTFTTSPVWTTAISMVAEELAWIDIDGDGVESFADTIQAAGAKKTYYTTRQPLYEIDSVLADGVRLSYAEFCYDTFHGWVSLAQTPSIDIVVFYRYSFTNDLTVSNWDTVSMAFANTSQPRVSFYADAVLGAAPLEVQFSDSSFGATEWTWQFGDGDSSDVQHPLHVYEEPGIFDITLTVDGSQGELSRTRPGLVAVYADTMTIDHVTGVAGDTVRIDVYARNYIDLTSITLAFTWAGSWDVRYFGFSTQGLRTDYFGDKRQINYDQVNKRAILLLDVDDQPPLSADTGAIISLYFRIVSDAGAGFNPVAFTSYSGYESEYVSVRGEYAPVLSNGAIESPSGCCTGPSRGNLDGSADNVVSLGDLTVLVDYLFISLTPLSCWEEGNLDGSLPEGPGSVALGDLTVLIDHLFISLSPLPQCP